ncbi:hypothetical protein Q5L94_13390, partial [Idiomarina sp. Sol25]|uniref:hypothetical protein n=1 Tax=Idiomarina sp. Sol25 TaxID=3064000 RepID=UPI00294B91C4
TSDRHSFTVRVVHVADTNSDVIARPEHEVTRVAGLVSGALKGWAPLPSATKIQFLGGFPAEEETPETCSYVCRFLVHITGD